MNCVVRDFFRGEVYALGSSETVIKKEKSNRRDLTQGSIIKKLVLFALPLLGGSLIQQLYNTVDVFFAGNFIKEGNAMAAVGATSMIVVLLVGFFNGMSVGCSVVISHDFGAHNNQKLQRSVHSAVGIALVGGTSLSILGFFVSSFPKDS